jgi:hypothetical protein
MPELVRALARRMNPARANACLTTDSTAIWLVKPRMVAFARKNIRRPDMTGRPVLR